MASGVEYQRLRETMLAYVNRKNGFTGIRRHTAGMWEAVSLILGRLETMPQGDPLIIQDATTFEFEPLPGYDSPYTP